MRGLPQRILGCFAEKLWFPFAQADAAPALPPPPPPGTVWYVPIVPEGVRIVRDLEFKRTPQRPLLLDLYLPKDPAPELLPLVVFIHGGGWAFGGKEGNPPAPLLERGFATASIQYRFSTEAPFPAQIADCRAAIRWLRAHGGEYGIDPTRIGVWGHSAGAHLCALLGTSARARDLDDEGAENLEHSCAVQAVCEFCGPTDLMEYVDVYDPKQYEAVVTLASGLLGRHLAESRDEAARANPMTYIAGGEPPFLIVQGGQDTLVPVTQSTRLYEALHKAGADATLVLLDQEGHGLENVRTDEVVFAFFERTLKRKRKGR
jgi:acetyl esterase/lipase